MRFSVILILIFCCCFISDTSGDIDHGYDLQTLLRLIDDKQSYMQVREQRIDSLKNELKGATDNVERYSLNQQLYQIYAIYKSGYAISYAQDNLKLALAINNNYWIQESQLDLASLYLTAGMYLDTYQLLVSVDSRQLESLMIVKYYDTWKNFYKFYAFNNSNALTYLARSDAYRDSLLSQLDQDTKHYQIVYAEKLFDNKEYEEAKVVLRNMLNQSVDEDHERAILAYALANVYRKEGNITQQRKYYIISATADIKNAIKENASMQALAFLLYETGYITEAYKCIKSSMEDAMFSNAKLRTYEVSTIFPIIDTAYQENEARQKSILTIFLISVCLLSLFLIIAIVYVYVQMRRVAKVRRQLYETNQKLNNLNDTLQSTNFELQFANTELSEVNRQLIESNQIKEAYIGQFLDLCSVYIDKLERYRLSLKKMVMGERLDELMRVLKSREMIDQEIKELFATFDHVFLHLYPNFVEDFNALLQEDEKLVLKPHEVLSTELRIFALIRLGITDSSKIAGFLHYSTNTIYTYRTKIRNKAAVPREEFDEMVMKIGRIKK